MPGWLKLDPHGESSCPVMQTHCSKELASVDPVVTKNKNATCTKLLTCRGKDKDI